MKQCDYTKGRYKTSKKGKICEMCWEKTRNANILGKQRSGGIGKDKQLSRMLPASVYRGYGRRERGLHEI